MTTKYTMGPWRVTRHKGLPNAVVAADQDIGSMPIAKIAMSNGDHEANARLIAAAPDMLAALKAILAHKPDNADTIWEQVEDAIAKATGAA